MAFIADLGCYGSMVGSCGAVWSKNGEEYGMGFDGKGWNVDGRASLCGISECLY